MSLRKGHFKSTSTAFFLLAGKASTQPWSWCNPLKSLAKIFLKRAGVFLNPGGILESDKGQKIQVHNNTGLKSHPQWPPHFTLVTPSWLSNTFPSPLSKPMHKACVKGHKIGCFYLFIFFICSGFCHTLKWNSHGFNMCSPSRSPLPPPSPPDPSGSSQCTRSERLPHASNLGWWSVSP